MLFCIRRIRLRVLTRPAVLHQTLCWSGNMVPAFLQPVSCVLYTVYCTHSIIFLEQRRPIQYAVIRVQQSSLLPQDVHVRSSIHKSRIRCTDVPNYNMQDTAPVYTAGQMWSIHLPVPASHLEGRDIFGDSGRVVSSPSGLVWVRNRVTGAHNR